MAAGAAATLGCPPWIGGISGDVQPGNYVTRYLQEAEARAVIRAAVEAATGRPADPCEVPTLAERMVEDWPFRHPVEGPVGAIAASLDLLAPAEVFPAVEGCPGGTRVAVGFEFLSEEQGDDADVSGSPDGFTGAERTAVEAVRARGEAALALFHQLDYGYDAWVDETGTVIDDGMRSVAEERLRAAVRAFIDELRRDGLI